MKGSAHRFYRSRSPVFIVLTALGAVVLAAAILFACLFFGFRKYIVYTPDGLRVEVPWLEEAPPESAEVPE